MFQGGSTLPAAYFTQRRASLRPWSGLESVPRNFADDDVNMRMHLGTTATVTLRQQGIYGNVLSGINHVTASCAIAVHGQHHDNASRTKTLEEECAHYKSENGMLRQQAKQLELAKNHYNQLVLQLQNRVQESEAKFLQFNTDGLATSRPPSNGNDSPSLELGTLSGTNLAPSSDPLSIAPSTVGIRKPIFPCATEAPLKTGSTEVHKSESNAPRQHPTRHLYSVAKGSDRDRDYPINVMERHEFANALSETALNNALHTPFEHTQRSPAVDVASYSKGNAEVESLEGEMAPELLSAKGSVSSAPQLGRTSADAATSCQSGLSLMDFRAGDESHFVDLTADVTECAEDVKKSAANAAAAHDKDSEGRPEELGRRASPLSHRKQPGDLGKSDKKTRSSSNISFLPEVYKEKDTGVDVQDAALLLIATFKDPLHAPFTSESTLSDAAGEMGENNAPVNCQAEEDFTVDERPKSTPVSSSASSVTARDVIGPTQDQHIPVLGREEAEAFNLTGDSTHSMMCSYCGQIPRRKVALCELCPRRFCLKCFRNDIQDSNPYTGTLDTHTRTLLYGREGDIFVKVCPRCIENSDDEFAPPSERALWMKHLLEELRRHDLSHCFRKPVDIAEHPGYVQSIGRHSMMDLSTMMTKVEEGKYSPRRGPGQFVEDLRKIWRNCRTFAGCDDLGKPTEGKHPPGIVRCALILEAMSRKFVLEHTSGKQVEWHPSAWDYYSSKKIQEKEEERLKLVALKKNTSERELIIYRVETGSNNLASVVEGSKRDASETKRSDNRLGFDPSTNKRLRLETVGPSNDGEEGGSCFLGVGHSRTLPRESRDLSTLSQSSSGCASSAQQQADTWKPLEDLSLVAYSFAKRKWR